MPYFSPFTSPVPRQSLALVRLRKPSTVSFRRRESDTYQNDDFAVSSGFTIHRSLFRLLVLLVQKTAYHAIGITFVSAYHLINLLIAFALKSSTPRPFDPSLYAEAEDVSTLAQDRRTNKCEKVGADVFRMAIRVLTRLMRTLILAYRIAQIGDIFEEDGQSVVEEQNPSELEQLRKFEDDAECERSPYLASIGTDAATQTTDSIDKPNLSPKEMGELATQCLANDRNQPHLVGDFIASNVCLTAPPQRYIPSRLPHRPHSEIQLRHPSSASCESVSSGCAVCKAPKRQRNRLQKRSRKV
jgi:hypothetical protein